FKFACGGLVDNEFIAQTLQLGNSGFRQSNTIAAVEALATGGFLERSDAETLVEAATFQQALNQVLRIAVEGTFQPSAATPGLKALLAQGGGSKSFEDLEVRLTQLQTRVRAIFEKVM